MPLPDLFHAAQELTAAVVSQMGAQAVQAADQVQQIPAGPGMIGQRNNAEDLIATLVGLGGWGGLFGLLAKYVGSKFSEAFAPMTAEMASMRRDIRGMRREMRRIRHSPPPGAYSDDEMPSPPSSKGHKSASHGEGQP